MKTTLGNRFTVVVQVPALAGDLNPAAESGGAFVGVLGVVGAPGWPELGFIAPGCWPGCCPKELGLVPIFCPRPGPVCAGCPARVASFDGSQMNSNR